MAYRGLDGDHSCPGAGDVQKRARLVSFKGKLPGGLGTKWEKGLYCTLARSTATELPEEVGRLQFSINGV